MISLNFVSTLSVFFRNAIVYYTTKEEAEIGCKQAAEKEIKGRALKVRMTCAEPKTGSETAKKGKLISKVLRVYSNRN